MQKLMFQKRENRGMKKCAGLGIVVAMAVVLLAGCSWETGSDATSWSSAFNWVSFNGTYRGASGGVLVSAYSSAPAVPATPASTNSSVETVRNESQGVFTAGSTVFSGNLGHVDIVPGSVIVSFYNNNGVLIQSAADSGGTGSNAVAGTTGPLTVQYASGAWKVDFTAQQPVTEDGYIQASYSFNSVEVDPGDDGEPAGNTLPGSSGRAIYSLSLVHQGQNLTLTDNNGAVYTGTIGEMRSASGYENTDITQVGANEQDNDSRSARYTYQESPLPPPNDTITATFACSGTSTAGYLVKIVGSLQGNVDITGTVFSNRRIDATWVEQGGKAGNVNGTTENIAITGSTTTTTGTNDNTLTQTTTATQ